MMRKTAVSAAITLFLFSGCGYTQKATLPKNIKSIYVQTVKNEIPINNVYAYQAGLEIDITNAIIKRLNVDGNLRVTDRAGADAILESSLIEFSQGGLRFTNLERIREYRLYVTVKTRLIDAKTGSLIWEEPTMTGDAEYEIPGQDQGGNIYNGNNVPEIPREEASRRAIERLAKNVVDRIVEDW
jgi:outer membrane lipopolysaccharide assembly protein LptE/RlpB